MASTQKTIEIPAFVPSPLVTAPTPFEVENTESLEINFNIQHIRKLETWQLQAISGKAGLIRQFDELNFEIKKANDKAKKIQLGTDLYDDCLKVRKLT